MQTQKDDIKSIAAIAAKIKSFFDEFNIAIDNKIVNEQESNNLYFELETFVKSCLEEIFGEEGNTKSNSLSSTFLKYNSLDNVRSDGVVFNYWSHKGEAIETPIRATTGQLRDNLFYKGYRWSNEEQKELFYRFFNTIKNALQGMAPVDFVTKYGVECDIRYLKIVGLNIQNIADTDDMVNNSKLGEIKFPILLTSNGVVHSIEFRSLLKLIEGMRSANLNEQQFDNYCTTNIDNIQNLEMIVEKAYSEAEIRDNDLLNKVRSAMINGLTNDEGKKREMANTITLRDAFNVITAYQYYDHPYDLHVYLPASNNGKLYSCLVISVDKSTQGINPYTNSFIELVSVLGAMTELDKKIWQQKKENIANYWGWEKQYEDFSDRHRRLSNVAMNICLAICRKRKVDVFSLPARLKEFESFYNKIVSRANGRDHDYPERPYGLSDADWATMRNEKLKKYREKIVDPMKNAELILRDIKDLVGLRIVCLYPAEKQKILDEFEKHKDKIQIEDLDTKDYPDPMGYRSTHISFTLSNERCKLYELDDLHERKCEIQIRTILEQGWADVSHKTLYKPGVPRLLVEKIKSEIYAELSGQAAVLLNVDQTFDRIVTRVKEICKQVT